MRGGASAESEDVSSARRPEGTFNVDVGDGVGEDLVAAITVPCCGTPGGSGPREEGAGSEQATTEFSVRILQQFLHKSDRGALQE